MPFKKGNPGRPVGSKNNPELMAVKILLEDAFVRNRSAALKHIDDLMRDKDGFKYLLTLKASLEPRQVNMTGEAFKAVIINYAHSVQRDRSPNTLPSVQ